MIDAADDVDFDERFSQLQKSWTEMETSNVGTSNFAPWFLRYKLAYMKNTMIQSVRKSAGFPLTEHFTTNATIAGLLDSTTCGGGFGKCGIY